MQCDLGIWQYLLLLYRGFCTLFCAPWIHRQHYTIEQ
nr:MAG TPA: hypothetical protein [Caudoviricetes sp.]